MAFVIEKNILFYPGEYIVLGPGHHSAQGHGCRSGRRELKVKGMYIGYLAGMFGMYAQNVLPPAGAILARIFCGPIVITRLPEPDLLTVKSP